MKFLGESALKKLIALIKGDLANKADKNHTHNYAGSSSAGGAANSANKLNTDAGSATHPVYFKDGVPVKTTYTLGASVPSDAKFTDTVTKVDATLTAGGTNPVQGSAIKTELDNLLNTLQQRIESVNDYAKEISNRIPEATTANNGQFLRVVNGVPTWIAPTNVAEEGV